MNKEQFLRELERHLVHLSQYERQEILQDFEEHFAIGIEKGETEQYIAASLGSPKQIADEVLSNYDLGRSDVLGHREQPDTARVVMVSILLIMFNLIVVIGPFVALVGIVFSGWVTSLAFVTSPFLFLFKVIVLPGQAHLFEFFMTIGLAGLGILIGIVMYYVTRFSIELTIRYVNFNVRVAKGEN